MKAAGKERGRRGEVFLEIRYIYNIVHPPALYLNCYLFDIF